MTAPIRGEFREVAAILPLDSEKSARIYPDMAPEYEDQWSTFDQEREGDGVWGVVIHDENAAGITERWGILGYEEAKGVADRLLEEVE